MHQHSLVRSGPDGRTDRQTDCTRCKLSFFAISSQVRSDPDGRMGPDGTVGVDVELTLKTNKPTPMSSFLSQSKRGTIFLAQSKRSTKSLHFGNPILVTLLHHLDAPLLPFLPHKKLCYGIFLFLRDRLLGQGCGLFLNRWQWVLPLWGHL